MEDDILFNFLSLHKESLKDIIINAPKDFDIIKLSNTEFETKYESKYNKWTNIKNIKFSGGAFAYIITKHAANIISSYININNNFIDNNIIINFTDIFIYRLVKTYIYHYSYFLSNYSDSTIHPSHANFHKYSVENQFNLLYKPH
jgi:hypothetical protein